MRKNETEWKEFRPRGKISAFHEMFHISSHVSQVTGTRHTVHVNSSFPWHYQCSLINHHTMENTEIVFVWCSARLLLAGLCNPQQLPEFSPSSALPRNGNLLHHCGLCAAHPGAGEVKEGIIASQN